MEAKRSRLPLILVIVGVTLAVLAASAFSIPDAPTTRTEHVLAAETLLNK